MPMEIDVRATNEDPLEIIKRGVNVWNRWRAENPDVRPDLEGADLSHFQLEQVNLKDVNLKHCNFTAAVLEGANLSGSDLSGAILEAAYLPTAILRQTKLSNTDLTGSVLSGATLHGANLNSANLSGANLSHADLSGAVFISTNLTGAVFSNALLASTVFEDIDFAEVKDLESAQHLRPSIIGLRTVYRDKVPNSFLRNAGVPDDFIIFLELWDQPKVEPNTILLTEKKLTPAFLSTTLNPFLSAIANLQYTISLIQGRPRREVLVKLISQNSPISINLDGASEAIQLLRETISPWRRRHAEKMARLAEREKQAEIGEKNAEILEKRARAAKDKAETEIITAEAAKLREETERIKLENERLRIDMHRAKIHLALDVLGQVAPSLSEAEKVDYVVKLLSPIDVLVLTELTLLSPKDKALLELKDGD